MSTIQKLRLHIAEITASEYIPTDATAPITYWFFKCVAQDGVVYTVQANAPRPDFVVGTVVDALDWFVVATQPKGSTWSSKDGSKSGLRYNDEVRIWVNQYASTSFVRETQVRKIAPVTTVVADPDMDDNRAL